MGEEKTVDRRSSSSRRWLWSALVLVTALVAGAAGGAIVWVLSKSLDDDATNGGGASGGTGGGTSGGTGVSVPTAPAVTVAVPSDLLYLFDRPPEPVFTLRGVNRDVAFDVPVSFLPERYQQAASEVRKMAAKAGVRLIHIPEISIPVSDFADVNTRLGFRDPFSRSSPVTHGLSVRLWHYFRESTSVPELLAKAVWARLHFNPEMVLDAVLVTILRSPLEGVKEIQLPELPLYSPEHFVDDEFFAKAREEMYVVSDKHRISVPVIRNVSQDDGDVMWYFGEDVHYNVMHWKWHIIYPAGTDDPEYVDLDRRGENFVNLHRQFVSRFNAERFTNGLPAVKPFNVDSPPPEGFFPKMIHLHGSKGIPGRQANSTLEGLPDFTSRHRSQLAKYKDAVKKGEVRYANGTILKLTGNEGLDVVSNLLEGNINLSPDYPFYGSIHNNLHGSLSTLADPLGVYKEPGSIVTDITAVAKDPYFYNIHMFMDDLYELYRETLTPYTKEELTPLPGVTLNSVSVQTEGRGVDDQLFTYYQHTDLDVSRGLDYVPPGRLYARFMHLQHRRFDYVLQLTNTETKSKRVFVRLYLLIVEDETGSKLAINLQRRFAITLDIFDVELRPGENTVRRASTDSALTMDADAIYSTQNTTEEVRRRNFCRCGWSQNLLLPRGTVSGTTYKLFAMVSDYDQDRAPISGEEVCYDGWILCGVPGSSHYPDKRPMAFPFDRPFRSDVKNIDELVTPNMALKDVTITFEDRTEGPTPLLPGGVSTSWMP